MQDFPERARLRHATNARAAVAASFPRTTARALLALPSSSLPQTSLLCKEVAHGSTRPTPHPPDFLLLHKVDVLHRASAALLSFSPVALAHGLYRPVPAPVQHAFHVQQILVLLARRLRVPQARG